MQFIGLEQIIWCAISNTSEVKHIKRRGRPSKKPREIEDVSRLAVNRQNIERYDKVMKAIFGDAYENNSGHTVKGCTRQDLLEMCDRLAVAKGKKAPTVYSAAKAIADRKFPPQHKDGGKRVLAKSKAHETCINALEKWYKRHGFLNNIYAGYGASRKEKTKEAKKVAAIFKALNSAGWPVI